MVTLYLTQHKVDKIGKLFDPNFEIDDFLTIKKVVISCQLFFTLSSHTCYLSLFVSVFLFVSRSSCYQCLQ